MTITTTSKNRITVILIHIRKSLLRNLKFNYYNLHIYKYNLVYVLQTASDKNEKKTYDVFECYGNEMRIEFEKYI